MLKKAAFLNACLKKITNMGTGNSKNSPDEQMRMKMENGFDEDDEDIEALGFNERDRDKTPRSKSNVSVHNGERIQNADGDEYFNKIYNKRVEKSLVSLNSTVGGSIGVKSAPPAAKKEKDPEVAAAIAELEETFKVLGDSALPVPQGVVIDGVGPGNQIVRNEDFENGISEGLTLEDDTPSSPCRTDSTRESDESGVDSQSETSPCPPQYDRHLITRGGESRNGLVLEKRMEGSPRRPNKLLELNSRAIGTSSGYSNCNVTYSSGGSSHITLPSRGLESRSLQTSSHSRIKNGRHSSNMAESVLMQQRKDFQRQQAVDTNMKNASDRTSGKAETAKLRQEDWTYQPPKIDGFDIEKFKEINSKVTTASIVPIILRDDEDKGYFSRSPDIPAYTKAELELIASLEREVY